MFPVPGIVPAFSIPAWPLSELRPTTQQDAWDGVFWTVEIYRPLPAMRASFQTRGLLGDWFALDWQPVAPLGADRGRYEQRFATLKPTRCEACYVLLPGTILNVGLCGPLQREYFNRLIQRGGGGVQGEFLEGPMPRISAWGQPSMTG
jgi:hypothetical protein